MVSLWDSVSRDRFLLGEGGRGSIGCSWRLCPCLGSRCIWRLNFLDGSRSGNGCYYGMILGVVKVFSETETEKDWGTYFSTVFVVSSYCPAKIKL